VHQQPRADARGEHKGNPNRMAEVRVRHLGPDREFHRDDEYRDVQQVDGVGRIAQSREPGKTPSPTGTLTRRRGQDHQHHRRAEDHDTLDATRRQCRSVAVEIDPRANPTPQDREHEDAERLNFAQTREPPRDEAACEKLQHEWARRVQAESIRG
jgi:hypothetical protein